MKKILLTALGWVSKVPGSTINEIYSAATYIVEAADSQTNVSGWEKLKNAVDYLVTLMPAGERYKAIASIVVTIIVNVALLVVRLKGETK